MTIVHLAVGWGVGQLKVGSFARGERMAKWNEALRVEEALGGARAVCRRGGAGTVAVGLRAVAWGRPFPPAPSREGRGSRP